MDSISSHRAKTGVRGWGIIFSALGGRIFKIPKAFISYGSPMKRPCGSARWPTVVWSQFDHFVTKDIIPGLRVSDIQFWKFQWYSSCIGHWMARQGQSDKGLCSFGHPEVHFVTRDIIQGLRVSDIQFWKFQWHSSCMGHWMARQGQSGKDLCSFGHPEVHKG